MIDTCQFQSRINNKGYIQIRIDNRWIYEHVYVVQQLIGRELKLGETIHHINGIKTDNRLSNLFLFKCQADHKSFENKVKQFGYTNPVQTMILNRWKDI